MTSGPIVIQSPKCINWLIDRKIVKNSYKKDIENLNARVLGVEEIIEELGVNVEDYPTQFFFLRKLFEEISVKDTTKDIFGRSSSKVRSVKDIIDNYAKYNLHIAEAGQKLSELTLVLIPRCVTSKSDFSRNLNESENRIKQLEHNEKLKQDGYKNMCNDFKLTSENVKLHLVQEACSLRDQFVDLIETLPKLSKVINLYTEFSIYIQQNDCKKCKAISLLIENKNATLYEFKHGSSPESSLPLHPIEDVMKELTESEAEKNSDGISFDIEVEEFDLEVVEDNECDGIMVDSVDSQEDTSEVNCDDRNVSELRSILDSIDGRKNVFSELNELHVFLRQFLKITNDSHNFGTTVDNTIGHDILQNGPSVIHEVTREEIGQAMAILDEKIQWFQNNTTIRLCMIRDVPGYLDRFILKIDGQKSQIDRVKHKLFEENQRKQELEEKLKELSEELDVYRKESKQLVDFLRPELKKALAMDVRFVGVN